MCKCVCSCAVADAAAGGHRILSRPVDNGTAEREREREKVRASASECLVSSVRACQRYKKGPLGRWPPQYSVTRTAASPRLISPRQQHRSSASLSIFTFPFSHSPSSILWQIPSANSIALPLLLLPSPLFFNCQFVYF